ncbi:MAG: DUF4334 domain-containing protein [Synechococcaceae cyanobacterium]|nr:DUF4334 domain-containing protein [Synechococcaceae cyanobacterium]
MPALPEAMDTPAAQTPPSQTPPAPATPSQVTPSQATPPLAGVSSAEEALALFDRLPAVEPSELLGRWRGGGFASGHSLDGVLETYHWYGKEFRGPDAVDPLLFRSAAGVVVPLRASLLPDPRWLKRWPWLASAAAAALFQRLLLPLLHTDRPQARLRVVRHRGVDSAAMLYDQLPIVDVFRRLDAHTLLGLMDARGIPQPFFFTLRRDQPDLAPPRG